MTLQRRHLLRQAGGLALLLSGTQLAWGAAIIGVRVWPARAYTRVTIESDVPLAARPFVTEPPHRLVVDIEGLELNPALRELVGKVRPDDPYIAGVRVGQFQPRVVRLVFDLKQPVVPQQFALPPVAAYQHRFVLDLYPPTEADPLLALVREREQGERQAAAAQQDLLGELIARVERPASRPGAPNAPATPALEPPPTPAAVLPPASAPTLTPPAAPPVTAAATPRELTASERQRARQLLIVALDPGHGGEDPGAIGPTGLREKDVVLAIALKLKERLEATPGMRVMLTRDADYFVPLAERVRRARRVQADLFVSIHADAFMRREARGASVFALSDRGATSAAARWMAERENGADDVGGVNISSVRDTQVLRLLTDMGITAQIRDSIKVGSDVLTQLDRVGRLHKPRVEQAGFAVLRAPDIPSILVETAFISNPEEEALLRDREHRQKIVEALARGIRRHFAARPPVPRPRQA